MRLNRLLGMTLELMAKRRVTAAELSVKFEVSVRTVYRDVELIDQAGIPVASFTGADGGFELMDGFFLTRQYFSMEDLSVIYTLLKAMQGALGSAVAPAMRKLASLHPSLGSDEELSKAVILDMSATERDRDIVHRLFQAIRQSRIVELAYSSASGTRSERRAEPLNLLWEKGVWYLEAYCRTRQAKRYFRVSRIERLLVTETTFAPRALPDEPERDRQSGMQAHLRFDKSVATRVLEQFPGEINYQGDQLDLRADRQFDQAAGDRIRHEHDDHVSAPVCQQCARRHLVHARLAAVGDRLEPGQHCCKLNAGITARDVGRSWPDNRHRITAHSRSRICPADVVCISNPRCHVN